jgi:hypothetical protein
MDFLIRQRSEVEIKTELHKLLPQLEQMAGEINTQT